MAKLGLKGLSYAVDKTWDHIPEKYFHEDTYIPNGQKSKNKNKYRDQDSKDKHNGKSDRKSDSRDRRSRDRYDRRRRRNSDPGGNDAPAPVAAGGLAGAAASAKYGNQGYDGSDDRGGRRSKQSSRSDREDYDYYRPQQTDQPARNQTPHPQQGYTPPSSAYIPPGFTPQGYQSPQGYQPPQGYQLPQGNPYEPVYTDQPSAPQGDPNFPYTRSQPVASESNFEQTYNPYTNPQQPQLQQQQAYQTQPQMGDNYYQPPPASGGGSAYHRYTPSDYQPREGYTPSAAGGGYDNRYAPVSLWICEKTRKSCMMHSSHCASM